MPQPNVSHDRIGDLVKRLGEKADFYRDTDSPLYPLFTEAATTILALENELSRNRHLLTATPNESIPA